ncbi:putative Ig domain-containing protein [Pseudoxanthomonas sp. X-1]|nr:putative Ig domain-containing protein [Pseudoxanthomonas sp. X-1]
MNSDSFYLEDEDNNRIVFNITINPVRTAGIAVSPSSANEDSGTTFLYTVTLSQASSTPTTVNLTRAGTATTGTDYTGAVGIVTVPANAISASFQITPVADNTVESDETVIFQVANGSGYTIGNPSSATATIVNDDYPSATIAVSPGSVTENGSANLVYTVSLSQPAPSALSIGFNVGGTATAGTDYATVNAPLVIPAGQTTGTITIDPTPDTTVEPDETVAISLNAGLGYTVGSPSSATGTILNDDQPALSINDVSQNEGSAGITNFTFTVSLSQPAGTGGVSFDIATANGTATAGSDYIAASVAGLTIPAGSSTATFTVQVNGDTLNEPDETFFVNATNVSGATVADGQGRGTIVNDDAVPTLSIGDAGVTEGNSGVTTATFTVGLSAASGQTVTVNYATADGTANAGSDYVARSGTLTFAPGTTAQTVSVTINGDTAVEPDETFTVALSGASNASIARATGIGTILNDDAVVTVAPASLPAATAGSGYSQTLLASGGVAPYTFSVSGGALPPGLSLSSAGVLSGTPTASGSFNFTVSAFDSGTPTAGSRGYTLTVASPSLTLPATTLPNGTAGQAYGAAINPASGGIAPYAYTVSAGALPAGLTVNSASGALSGTPTVAGNFSFTLTATDSTSGTPGQVTRSYTLAIVTPTLTVVPPTLPPGTAGSAYSQTLSASGGTAPYSYALSSGALPAGLTLSSAGTLAGTPTVAGSFTFVVGVTDAGGFGGAQAYTLSIAAPTLAITPPTLPAAAIGASYSQTLSTGGGTAPYTYTLSAGALPAGLGLSAGGVLSGTPTAAGSFAFTVSVTDAGGFGAAQAFTLTVASPTLTLAPPTLPSGTAGSAYSQALSTSGGAAPYSYSITSGSLPTGLSLSAGGVLSGTPTVAGSFVFTVQVTDSTAGVAAQTSRSYTLTLAAPTLVIAPPTLPAAAIGASYRQALSTSGGAAPYTYTLGGGSLPSGISLSAAGVLSGTPAAAGSFAFTVSVTDAGGFSAAQAFTLDVASPTLVLTPPTLPAGTAGTAYSQALSTSGGTAPYSYSLASGALPAGLSLSPAGTLSGTPTQAGSFVFSVTVADSTAGVAGQASRSYTLSIAAPTLTIGQPTLPPGTAGTAYRQVLSVSGGAAPYAYSVATGALPAGLSLTTAGVLSGTPSAAGSFAFSIQVSDANGFSASQAYTLAIASAVPPPVAVNDSGATLVDTPLTLEVTRNDSGSIDSIAVASAPGHGTATVDGVRLVYTPAPGYVGTDSVRYTAIGAGGSSAPATVTLTVNARPVAASATVPAVMGQTQTVELTRNATGGPFVAAAVVAVLPANAGTATIARTATAATGVPTAAAEGPGFVLTFVPSPTFSGQATVRFTLSNAYATSDAADIVFAIAPRPDPTQDAQVRGLIDAQAESTRRFAKAQIDNFQRRLEATHRGARGFDNGVSFQATSRCRQNDRSLEARPCEPGAHDPHDGVAGDSMEAASSPSDAGAGAGNLGLWVGGAIRSGSLDKQAQRAGVDFQSDGLSLGADYLVSSSLAVGAGVGWGRDDSDVGHEGSRSKATAYTMALYASYHPGQTLFFDALVGYQLLSYDLRRYVTDNGALAEGDRDGKQWIASLSSGADLQRGDWQITPYARVDVARATLDGYTESAMAPFALRYADMDVSTTTGNLGLRLEWRRQMSWGRLTPQFRLEYQHDFQGRGDATLGYADTVGGPLYRTGQSVFDRNRLMLGVGAAFTSEQGLSTRVEYRGVTDGDSGNDQTWMFNIEKKY